MQNWQADVRVSKLNFFPAKGKLRAMMVIHGHTTGLKSTSVMMKAYGSNAEHAHEYLQPGSLCAVSGVYQVDTSEKDGKTEYFHYFELTRPIEFIAGTKSHIERLKLPAADSFANAKAAKDYCADIIQPLGFMFLPTMPFSYLQVRVEAANDDSLTRVIAWLKELSTQWDA
ncbi:MAG: hypothetical protein R3309_08715 [Reinekea sp.]|nr:hypothetical protein [Reinekea sp.]